jgi:hypothetical protein
MCDEDLVGDQQDQASQAKLKDEAEAGEHTEAQEGKGQSHVYTAI